jgi:tetratricopeptide (TPR) repeat protein
MDINLIYALAAIAVLLLLLLVFLIKRINTKRRIGFKDRISLDKIIEGAVSLKDKETVEQPDNLTELQNSFQENEYVQEFDYHPMTGSSLSLQKGTALLKEGKYDDAITFFSKSIENNPANADAYYSRALAKSKLNLLKDSIDDFTDAILRQLNDPDVYYQRGKLRLKIGDKENALKDLTNFISLRKSNAEAFFLKGTLEFDIENYEAAISDFTNAISLDKNYADAYFKRGLAKHRTGYVATCCKDLKTAFEKGNLEAYHYLKLYCS